MSDRDDAWILTFTGRKFWPLDPRAEDVCIEDIAHALALTCRFTGHCREFYSVAQHSVLCSRYVALHGGNAELQLAALLHDAGEAYLPDVARPIKGRLWISRPGCPYMTRLRAAEERLQGAIEPALGMLFVPGKKERQLLKDADIALLLAEKRDLMPDGSDDWRKVLGAEDVPEWEERIRGWCWEDAEELFLDAYGELRREVSRG